MAILARPSGRTLGVLVAATTGAGLLLTTRAARLRSRMVGARGLIIEDAVAINRSPAELYAFWRRLERIPQLVPEIESVEMADSHRSRWVARAAGRREEWCAEIINDVPNHLLAWQTVGRSDIDSAGSIHFEADAPGRGTVVRVKLQCSMPGGRAGAAFAWLFGESPSQVLREGLRRLKQLMETGEIPTTAGQPRGRR
jgi:uncharacterized membrane protein